VFPFKIVSPDGIVFNGTVRSLRLPGLDGEFGVLARHAPMLAGVQAGVMQVEEENGARVLEAVGDGFLEVDREGVTLLSDFTNRPEDVDVSRAQAALERAQERLRERGPELDVDRAEAALRRAVARLKVAGA
jgi:F-type H+-transporting ATPase subunit epsilon